MDKKGIDLAAALAGQVNRDLQDVPNRAPINPKEFLRAAGVPMNAPASTPARNYPGMIEPPKSTPAGSEVIGIEVPTPNLIPMPDDLKKFVEDVPEIYPDPGMPTQSVAQPEEWSDTSQHIPLYSPPSGKISLSDVVTDIQQRLDRIEQFILKRDKYWSKSRNNKSKKKSTKHEATSSPFPGSEDTTGATSGNPS